MSGMSESGRECKRVTLPTTTHSMLISDDYAEAMYSERGLRAKLKQ